MINRFNNQPSALEGNKNLCRVVTDLLWNADCSYERKIILFEQLRVGILEYGHGVELANEITFLMNILAKKEVI